MYSPSPRMPPNKEIEFSIDLIPDTPLISKVPYGMASALTELKEQIYVLKENTIREFKSR